MKERKSFNEIVALTDVRLFICLFPSFCTQEFHAHEK